MRCPRCQSTNLVKIGHLIYCRNCISFGQIRPSTRPPQWRYEFQEKEVYYDLSYDLSRRQKEIASEIIQAIKDKKHVLVQAVCGSGKTEIVYPCICYALNQSLHVGFACPRKDLAIELYDRLSNQLKGVEMALVYGGHHDDLYQPLVILTTHQLYRYWNYFDVLIIDEIDAFPFYGNLSLYKMAVASNKGCFILMSATTYESAPPKGFVKLTLDRRYHNQDLPMPKLVWLPNVFSYFYICRLITFYSSKKIPMIIFVPEKKDFKIWSKLLRVLNIGYGIVHSTSQFNTKTLEAFRQKEFLVLLSTTLMERGVTFENVQVVVFKAHHVIFNRSTLIQIAGRVGRKPNFPNGDVIFVGKYISKEMIKCRKYIISKNAPYATKKPMGYFNTKKR